MQTLSLPLVVVGLIAAFSSGTADPPDQVVARSLGVLDCVAPGHDGNTVVNGRGGDGEERSGKTKVGRSASERKWLAARREHEKAKELVKSGLREAHQLRTARRLFRAAITHNARARHVLEGLKQACKGDAACAKKVETVLRTVRDDLARTHLHIADLYRDRAAELVSKGLRKSRSVTTARRLFLAALRQHGLAHKAIHELETHDHADARIRRLASTAALSVRDETIRIRLHLAHLYTARQNYNRALRWVNGALAMDPDHKTALATRARIEIAISNSSLRLLGITNR